MKHTPDRVSATRALFPARSCCPRANTARRKRSLRQYCPGDARGPSPPGLFADDLLTRLGYDIYLWANSDYSAPRSIAGAHSSDTTSSASPPSAQWPDARPRNKGDEITITRLQCRQLRVGKNNKSFVRVNSIVSLFVRRVGARRTWAPGQRSRGPRGAQPARLPATHRRVYRENGPERDELVRALITSM